MPRTSSVPRYPGSQLVGSAFSAGEWRRLTTLPAEVMIASIAARGDPAHRTVAEGLAGLDAIAAGRGSDSDLVRMVVAAIYSEPEDDRPPEVATPAPGLPHVLADCRRVADVLRAGADPADAAAYRHWVQQVAARVFAASRSGGVFGLSGERISASERAFLNDLATALA